NPLIVDFPKPMDHALLGRLIWLVDARGKKVEGKTRITNREERWEFRPSQPWDAGHYNLVVDAALEDLAGNSIGRPFEIDVFRAIDAKPKTKTIKIPIEIGSVR